jgi:hypothetical protein
LWLALLIPVFMPPGVSAGEDNAAAALEEVNRVRSGLGLSLEKMKDLNRYRSSHGRPAREVEGWRRTGEEEIWPIDQATFDIRSGRLSKYVSFVNVSRRKAGESILSMGSISTKADAYLHLLIPGADLALEGIERYRLEGRESVYYEVRYSPQPQEVIFFHPLAKMLLDASTGRLYRFEMAADFLGVGAMPDSVISGASAARLAALYLQRRALENSLGRGTAVSRVLAPTLYFVRPNTWLEGEAPSGGVARAAWVVPFQTGGEADATPHLLFVDALSGKSIGGIEAASAP